MIYRSTLASLTTPLALMLLACGGGASDPTAVPQPTASAPPPVASTVLDEPPPCPPLEEQPARATVTPKLQRVPEGFLIGFDVSADGRLAIASDGDSTQIWDIGSLTLQATLPAPALNSGSGNWATARWNDLGTELGYFTISHRVAVTAGKAPTWTEQKLQLPAGFDAASVRGLEENRAGLRAARLQKFGLDEPSVVAVWRDAQPGTAPLVISLPRNVSSIGLAGGAPVLVAATVEELPEKDDADAAAAAPVVTTYFAVDLKAGAKPRRFFSQPGYGGVLAVADDGSLAVASKVDGPASIVETASGAVRSKIGPPYARALSKSDATLGRAGAFTRDNKSLVAAFRDTLSTYDVATGRLTGVAGGRVMPRTKVRYAGSDRIVTVGEEGATTWSAADGTATSWASLPKNTFVGTYDNGDLLAATWGYNRACSADGSTSTLVTLRRVAKNSDEVGPAVVSGQATTAPRWPLAAGESTSFCPGGFPGEIDAERGKIVIIATANTSVLDLATNKAVEVATGKGAFAMGLSGDGSWIAVENGGVLTAVDTTTGKVATSSFTSALPPIPSGKSRRVSDWHLAPDRSALAVVHDGDSVSFVRADGKLGSTHRFQRSPHMVRFVSPKGAVATFEDGSYVVFEDGKIGREGKTGSTAGYEDLAGAPDGRSAALLGVDRFTYVVDLDTAQTRASLLDFADREYIALTPSGAYTGTAEVAHRIGWSFESPSEVFGFELFASALKKADVVKKRLAGESVDLPTGLVRPPALALAAPPRLSADGKSVTLSLDARSSSRVDVVRIFVEGRPAASQAVCKREEKLEITAPLLPGTNHVAAIAFDALGYSSRPLTLSAEGPVAARRPDVWVVAVGVSAYPLLGPDQQLEAADDDARSIGELFRTLAGPGQLFENAHVAVLTDRDVTAAKVEEALRASTEMGENDVLAVFLSGHGDKPSETEDTMLLTSASDGTPESLRKTGIGWGLVGKALKDAKGRALVLMDACHAGHVSRVVFAPNEALARSLERDHRAGAFVFAASKGSQASFEANTKKGVKRTKVTAFAVPHERAQGLFTGAFVESAHADSTDRNGDGLIQLSELVDEVRGRVQLATEGVQVPWVVNRSLFGDFAIARLAPK